MTMKSGVWPDLLEKGLESDQASICGHFPDHIVGCSSFQMLKLFLWEIWCPGQQVVNKNQNLVAMATRESSVI